MSVSVITAQPRTKADRRRINLGFDRFSGLYLWAAFIITFTLWVPESFPTASTLHSVAAQYAITGVIAMAVLVPMCAGQYDLSVGANANVSGVLAVVLLNDHAWGVAPVILAGVGLGLVVGLVNAIVVVRLGVNSFIATLGMSSVLAATQVIVSNNSQPIPPTSQAWANLTLTEVFGFQIVVLYLLVVAVVIWWLLAHTPAGRYLYAIGGNPEAARLSGVRSERWSTVSLVVSGILSGLAGVLYTSLNGPSLDFGGSLLLPAFAAVFLGSTQLTPGRFNVWGTLLAIYVLATGVQGLQLVSGEIWLSDMFNGVALILAVALSIKRTPSATRQRLKAKLTRGGGSGSAGQRPPDSDVAVAGAK